MLSVLRACDAARNSVSSHLDKYCNSPLKMIVFSSYLFGFSNTYIFGRDRMDFTEESESKKAEIIKVAKAESQYCLDFINYLFDYFDEEPVSCIFSAPIFNKIVHACNSLGEQELLSFYLRVYKIVVPTMREMRFFDYVSKQTIDSCFRLHMNAEDVGEIGKLMLSLKRIPVAFIVEKYLKSRPKKILEYVNQSTFIYNNSSLLVDVDATVVDQDACGLLVRSLYRICNQLKHFVYRQYQRSFIDLSWESVNAEEGTSFSESFINWLKWATAQAQYIGTRERNDGYPSWCFAPFSMDVCSKDEITSGLCELYDMVCDVLGMERENDVTIGLQQFYKEDVLPDDVVYRPIFTDDPRYDPSKDNEPLPYTGHVVSKSNFFRLCQRLVFAANANAYIKEEDECIVIPAGKAVEKYGLIRKV